MIGIYLQVTILQKHPLRMLPPFSAPEEATIIATGGNSAGSQWDNSHPGLIDNDGLDGLNPEVTAKKCAVSQRTSNKIAFLSMKLDAPKTVLKLQLAQRTQCCLNQGQNVKVQVGTSSQYNANDPVCMEIAQLSGTGLVDYDCDQFHAGQYVIISNDQSHLTICEAKVFVIDAGNGNMPTLLLKALQSK